MLALTAYLNTETSVMLTLIAEAADICLATVHINSFEPDTTSGVFTVAIYTIACISYANEIPAQH